MIFGVTVIRAIRSIRGPTNTKNVILDMYVAMDNYVGEVMRKQPDTPLLIISDHGHGARPVYTVRINELLRRAAI